MRTWTRARINTHCGYCGESIAKDAPLQQITLTAVTRPRLRCQLCAEGTVPDNIPVHQLITLTYVDEDGIERPRRSLMSPLVPLAADWKLKASGDEVF